MMQRGSIRPRRELTEQRRTEILDAAEQLVAVHGFDALRLRDVSAVAGVSIGLIQHYFTTRDELLRETMRVAGQRRVEQWTQLAEGYDDPQQKLIALLEGAIHDQHRCVVWLETCAAATRHAELLPDVRGTQAAWSEALAQTIDDGIASHAFAPTIPTADIVALLVGLIDGLMLSAATGWPEEGNHEYPAQLLRDAAQRLLRSHER